MITKKQLRGIVFCGIAFFSLIFAFVCFIAFSVPFGMLFILATFTYTTLGLFDLLIFPEEQKRRAPQAPRQNYNPQVRPQAPAQNTHQQQNGNTSNNQAR